MTDLRALSDAATPDPQAFIPGYRIRYIELQNAAAFLKSQGWAGGIGFDEAVKALAASPSPDTDAGLDVDDLAERLAGRTMLLQKALSDPSEPFIENWRTVARVLLRG